MKRTAVLLGHEGVRLDGFTVRHRHDEIHIAGPRAVGVETRGLSGVVGMAVVVAHDVLASGVNLALDADWSRGSISYRSRARSTTMLRARLASVAVREPRGPTREPQISCG